MVLLRSLDLPERFAPIARISLSPRLGRGLSVALALSAAGCDSSLIAESPSYTCIEAGDQCILPSGPLGVCERTACASDSDSPCFQCVSQH
jgi:hypothetical protein